MPIVKLPDGTKLNFPDGMSQSEMADAIDAHFPSTPKAAPVAPASTSSINDDFDFADANTSDGAAIMAAASQPRTESVLQRQPWTAPVKPLIEQRGAPVTQEYADGVKKGLDLATPEQRALVNNGKGFIGSVARAQNQQIQQSQKSVDTLRKATGGIEDRAERFIEQGAGADAAMSLAQDEILTGDANAKFASPVYDEATSDLVVRKSKDLGLSALQIPSVVVKGLADITQLITADTLGGGVEKIASEIIADLNASKSTGAQIKSLQLQRMMADGQRKPSDILGYLIENPDLLVEESIPSLGSMVVPLAGAAGAGRIAQSMKFIQKMPPAEREILLNSIRTGGATAGNTLLNAGDTFSETKGDLSDKYTAAGIAGLGSLLVGMATGGGAEGAIARGFRGGVGGKLEIATKGTLREQAQEFGEASSQSIGQQIAETGGVDFNKVAKQGTLEAAMAGPMGAMSGIGEAVRSGQPLPQSKATSFANPNGPASQAGITPIVIPDTPAAAPAPQAVGGAADAASNVANILGIPNVSTPSNTGGLVNGAIAGGMPNAGAGVGVAGSDASGGGLGGGNAQGTVASTEQGQSVSSTTQQSSDVAPEAIWAGQRGDGYQTSPAAERQIPARQKERPDLEWKTVQLPSGNYILHGYKQGNTNAEVSNSGTVAGQAAAPAGDAAVANASAVQGVAGATGTATPTVSPERAAVQAQLDSLHAAEPNKYPKVVLADPEPEAAAQLQQAAQETASVFGVNPNVVVFSDPSPDSVNGFELDGKVYVNTKGLANNALKTGWHETHHVLQAIAEADDAQGKTDTPAQVYRNKVDALFDTMDVDGKRSYITNFLYKDELKALPESERAAAVEAYLTAPLTRREMMADFVGNRATDKEFIKSLAKADPKGFKEFAAKWLDIIDGLIKQLRGNGKNKESAKVDKHVADLNKARMVLRDAMVELRNSGADTTADTQSDTTVDETTDDEADLQAELDAEMELVKKTTRRINKNDISLSKKETDPFTIDPDFMDQQATTQKEAELRAQLVAKAKGRAAGPAGVTLDQMKAKGMNPELAFPFGEAIEGKSRIEIDMPKGYNASQYDGIYKSKVNGRWMPSDDDFFTVDDNAMSKDFAVQYYKNQLASQFVTKAGFDLADAIGKDKALKLAEAWKSLAKKSGMFKLPLQSSAGDIVQVAKDMDAFLGWSVTKNKTFVGDQKIEFKHKTNGKMFSASIVEEGNDTFHVNTMDMEGSGGLGSQFYSVVSEWAAANNKKFVADNLLSSINTYRRPEQAASYALKTGRTATVLPGDQTRVYGFNETPFTTEDNDLNIARLMVAGLRNAKSIAAIDSQIDNLRYNPNTDKFTTKDGKDAEATISAMLKDVDARAVGVGRTTLARSVVTNSILAGDFDVNAVTEFKLPIAYSKKENGLAKAIEESAKDGKAKKPKKVKAPVPTVTDKNAAQEGKRTAVVVSSKPGREFSVGDEKVSIVKYPAKGDVEAQTERLHERVRGIVNGSAAQNFLKTAFGTKASSISEIRGLWAGERESTFVIRASDAEGNPVDFATARKMSNLLGMSLIQEGSITVAPSTESISGVDPTPAVLIGLPTGEKIDRSKINEALAAANDAGFFGASEAMSGKGVKFLFFPDDSSGKTIDEQESEFIAQIKAVQQKTGLTGWSNYDNVSTLDGAGDYWSNANGTNTEGEAGSTGLQDSEGRSLDLFRGSVEHILAPYIAALKTEGFDFDAGNWQRVFGASDQQRQYVESEVAKLANINKHGVVKKLRQTVNISEDKDVGSSALITQKTTNANAEQQLANLDTVIAKAGNPVASTNAWLRMMAIAFGTNDVPMAPNRFIQMYNNDGIYKQLKTLSAGQVADADHGFKNAAEFRKLYESGKVKPETTAKLMLWSFLSRGVSPYVQESGFIDLVDQVAPFVDKALAGKVSDDDVVAWEKVVSDTIVKGTGQPGAGTTHNANAFGSSFLRNMAEQMPDGRTKMRFMHDLFSDPTKSGREIRREFVKISEGVGIDNKVISFTLLVIGHGDVAVFDRVQISNTFDDGRLGNYNLYDGVTRYGVEKNGKIDWIGAGDTAKLEAEDRVDTDGGKVATALLPGSGMANLTTGARGLLIYEPVETALDAVLPDIFGRLKSEKLRSNDTVPSVGRWHWESWVAHSGQEASHKTLDALLNEVKGTPNPFTDVPAKEGEYGAYNYAVEYALGKDGSQYKTYTDSKGNKFRFTLPRFGEFMKAMKKKGGKKSVAPVGFKVSANEDGSNRTRPWYEDSRVNRQRLDEIIAEYGTPMGMPSFSKKQTDTPEFKEWFGDSKVVDFDGTPLIVYHGSPERDFYIFDINKVNPNDPDGPYNGFFFSSSYEDADGAGRYPYGRPNAKNPQTRAFYLSLQNPATRAQARRVARELGDSWRDNHDTLQEAVRIELQKQGFDGIIHEPYVNPSREAFERDGRVALGKNKGELVKNTEDGGVDLYEDGMLITGYMDFDNAMEQLRHGIFVAFRPEQIKSATENNGNFDGTNPDIRYSKKQDVSPAGYYSALARGIDTSPTQAQAKDGWKAYIKGLVNKGAIKQDEVEWTGVNDWLDMQEGRVSKDSLSQFLKDNGVQVQETQLGESDKYVVREAGMEESKYFDSEREARKYIDKMVDLNVTDQSDSDWSDDDWDYAREREEERFITYEPGEWKDSAKYSQYVLPGGENYREVLLTLPKVAGKELSSYIASYAKKYGVEPYLARMEVMNAINNPEERIITGQDEKELQKILDANPEYKSSHWEQKNVLAHIRLNDRTDADGNKVLFVEELQSDWAQDGRKRGFIGDLQGDAKEYAELDKQFKDGTLPEAKYDRFYALQDTLGGGMQAEANKDGVVRAPFVQKTEGWLNLALKRVIKMAVDGGYDKVAFVNGEQSAERYSLAKKVEYIEYEKTGANNYYIRVTDKQGGRVLTDYQQTPAQLEEKIGKDLTMQIVRGDGKVDESGNKTIYAKDFVMGGEGMKAFYDKIVPLAAGKLADKLGGAKMGMVSLSNSAEDFDEMELDSATDEELAQLEATGRVVGLTQPGFPITDKMRETASGGMPLFSKKQNGRVLGIFERDDLGRWKWGLLGAALDKFNAAIDPALSWSKMKAISPELAKQIRHMKLEIQKAQDRAVKIAGETQKLSIAEREMVSDIIEKELAAGTIPPSHAVNMALVMNQAMGDQSAELVRLGMLTKETADQWNGKYLPRYYESKFRKKAADAWADAVKGLRTRKSAMAGITGKHLKGRGIYEAVPVQDHKQWEALGWEVRDPTFDPAVDKEIQMWRDFTREERDNMGEIRDAGFRFVMGYMQTQKDIALGRMFEGMANDPKVAKRKEIAPPGWVEVPNTIVEGTGAKRYGKLGGKWVSRDTMSHLSQIEESQSEVMQMYRKALGLWKEGKTVMNPVSHVNNVLSNLSMSHFAGVSYWHGHKYAAAIRDFATGKGYMDEARENGVFMGTFTNEELMNTLPEELQQLAKKQDGSLQKTIKTGYDALNFFLRKPMGAAYQAEDTFFRYLLYKDGRDSGLTPDQAIENSLRYIFSYDDLPQGARRVRDFALPFFSYTYKFIPAFLHTAANYPHRLVAPAAMLYFANAAMYAIASGDDEDDWATTLKKYATDPEARQKAKEFELGERQFLPPWMKGYTALGTPKAVRLGTDDTTGLPLFIDVARVIPGGDMLDMVSNSGGVPMLAPFTISHPIFTVGVGMMANRDLFTGRDLVTKIDTDGEAAQKRLAWLYRQAAPAIAIGNYHWQRTMGAIAQANDGEVKWVPDVLGGDATGIGRDGLPIQPKYAAMQTFGIKVKPIDLEESESMLNSENKKLLRDLDAQMRRDKRLYDKGAISDRTMEKLEEDYDMKRERLNDGMTIDGDERN
jgi:hypothetical protein